MKRTFAFSGVLAIVVSTLLSAEGPAMQRAAAIDETTSSMMASSYSDPAEQTVRVIREDVDDPFFAMNLFRENRIEMDEERMTRIVRGEHETLVWVNIEFAGLPVFFHEVGYTFDARRRVAREPGTDKPSLLGDPSLPASAFPIDHSPDVSSAEAIDKWLTAASEDELLGPGYEPRSEAEAMLGFFNVRQSDDGDPVFRLGWRVAQTGSKYPIAIIGAKKGDVLFFDPGVQTSNGSQPRTDPEIPDFRGEWRRDRCGTRSPNRRLILNADGTFQVIDSGQVTYSGSWETPRPTWIQLNTGQQSSRNWDPLARNLDYDANSGKLLEATPGAAQICTLSRVGDVADK